MELGRGGVVVALVGHASTYHRWDHAADDKARAAILLPATLRYEFFPHGSYVDMARFYRDDFLMRNPSMNGATLTARATKPGFANLKDGVYAYFWDDARDGAFMTSVHDAGVTHATATTYYGSHDLSDAQLTTMYQAAKAAGWTAGMYTDPGGNLSNVAMGSWVNDVLTAPDPTTFFTAHSQNWDTICTKEKALSPTNPQTPSFVALYGNIGLELAYFDTYVTQDAPCLDASHTEHNALAPTPALLPSPLEEERALRLAFLAAMRQAVSAVGSGEGSTPAWAIPSLDFFEGSMMLRTYGENTDAIPSGGYANDFAPATDPPPPGINTDETHRIPLLELMFHDYFVGTWDWRDSNFQYLGTSRKKDLFNALYGTMPMWHVTKPLWNAHEQQYLDSYAFQARSRSIVGFDDMVGHGFLSDDREVQFTDWASGTRIIANFDENARTVGGQTIAGLDFIVVQSSSAPPAGDDAGAAPVVPSSGSSSGCACDASSTGPQASSALVLLGFLALRSRRRTSTK